MLCVRGSLNLIFAILLQTTITGPLMLPPCSTFLWTSTVISTRGATNNSLEQLGTLNPLIYEPDGDQKGPIDKGAPPRQ